ncbi:nucleoside triphosphate pyrophosphohydrolase [Adlercreutzia sp. ZJ242]|uniref:nucleoside triphosphate pyrophosphohydrolase n=1 Tax=Adlercreutzia sp. ZJ242 TaxID=2709409 RepID=UPI0013EAFF51|nr:nucleoside triphosphate pyrophosphohydrolase [Adlercreutzia sp. ZJ242]
MTSKSVAEVTAQRHPDFDAFVATIEALRAPDGCPWDREQTHRSIAHNMIEEAYEAVDAIERGSVAHLREELGDVLLQVVLQSQIAADAGAFTIDDVCRDVNEKMIRRHPHVFGEEAAADSGEVLGLWEKVKLAEKEAADAAAADAGDGAPEGLLDGVPASFPALMQAQKISRKAAAAGFEWDTLDDIWSQVAEEVGELKEAYAAAPRSKSGKIVKGGDAGATPEAAAAADAVELEFGDVLFALVNVARRMGVNAENALRATCVKFRRRWAFMEGAAWGQGRRVEDLPTEELEELWRMAKMLEGGEAR